MKEWVNYRNLTCYAHNIHQKATSLFLKVSSYHNRLLCSARQKLWNFEKLKKWLEDFQCLLYAHHVKTSSKHISEANHAGADIFDLWVRVQYIWLILDSINLWWLPIFFMARVQLFSDQNECSFYISYFFKLSYRVGKCYC